MKIKQAQINNLQEQFDFLIKDQFNWGEAPVICELNGVTWLLGQESDVKMTWKEAISWCVSVGGELPSREILLHCYMNEAIKKEFATPYYYWSSTEFNADYAWTQSFNIGFQFNGFNKINSTYVRAVRRLVIDK